jgi:deoxycytidine triphosphate deaminase/intein/homing endonuclease
MSIKSDRWIRRMATQGMIEPFSPDQVRVSNGHRIVSYGTSSYGYDVRCADDFKIFTNINSTIVDPKAFDEKSFVDFKGPVCIIPPNSFALASTVEYFRIPRSVLTVCLGKCVTGDTRVVDADTGAYIPITEMRWGKSTLGLDNWKLKSAKVSAFIPQGRKEVFELRTRAGLRIRATANHPFRQLNGWTPLSDLRPGDRIAAARNIPVFGKTPIPDWEASLLGLMISEGQCDTPGHSPSYTTADLAMVQQKYGMNVGAAEKFVPQAIFTAPKNSVRLFLQSLFSGNGSIPLGKGAVLEYHSSSRRLIEDVHHLLLRFGVFSLIRQEGAPAGKDVCKLQIADEEQILSFAEMVGFSRGSVKQQQLDLEVLPLIRARVLNCRDAQGALAAGDFINPSVDGPAWDVVEEIESVGVEEVFDISVPLLHNFVANDLIVHNSTYARCFRGDTRVALVDGTAPTLEEMAKRADSGEIFWGYSIGENGRLIVSLLDAPRFIGMDALLEVELDDGAIIHATPDHLFMRRDGRMVEAHKLRPNDALMPLYRDLFRGYEEVYQPVDGYLYATHRLADDWNLRHGIYPETPGTHRHHVDFNRRNNRPTNLVRLEASEHIRLHNAENYGGIRRRLIEERRNHDTGSIRGAAAKFNCGRSVFRRFPDAIAKFRGTPAYRNHKVAAIRALPGDHDVYCLTVPEAGNFALEAGVFVHNCGIIVNVTPLEPEWEGHVTLEFSNTTPLPAKIYANEGVAQMLFFESDEVCETSYADRGGKYQGQRGVTLPKT